MRGHPPTNPEEMGTYFGLLERLGFDLARPILPDLGFDAASVDPVRDLSRQALLIWDDVQSPDPWDPVDPVRISVIVGALDRIAEIAGKPAADRIMDLAAFEPDRGEAALWEGLLRQLARPPTRRREVPFPFDQPLGGRIHALALTIVDLARTAKLDALSTASLSAWDAERNHRFWEHAGEDEPTFMDEHPWALSIESWVKDETTRRVLEDIGHHCTPSERRQFVAWGRDVAKVLDIPVSLVHAPEWAWT